jgi:hypothetical protein
LLVYAAILGYTHFLDSIQGGSLLSVSKLKSEKEVEDELVRLRLKIWKSRSRFSRSAGIALLVTSAIFLFLAYITRYIVFEVSSILALFLGVIFVLSEVEPHVKLRVANEAITSPLSTLCEIVNHFDLHGRGIYIPTKKEGQVKLFLPKDEDCRIPKINEITGDEIISKAGLVLSPIGRNLLKLYEEEIGDVDDHDLNYLMEWLPRVIVGELKLAEALEIAKNNENILVKITNLSINGFCKNTEVKRLCTSIGCPVISSIAEAIAKNTGRIVYYRNCAYEPSTRINEANYQLGPLIQRQIT